MSVSHFSKNSKSADMWGKSPPLLAAAAAGKQFAKEQSDAEIKNFSILFIEHPDTYEVVFVPDQMHPEDAGGKPVQYYFGGRTMYGLGVHYFLDKTTYKIIRQHWDR